MTKTCICGCGEAVPSGHGRKYATPACRERAKRRREGIMPREVKEKVARVQKVCLACGKPIIGKGKYCKLIRCQKTRVKREKAMKVAANKRSRDKEKKIRIEGKPRFCAHCGNQLTIEDSLKLAVCHREECKTWWDTEKQNRVNARNSNSRKRLNGRNEYAEKKRKDKESGENEKWRARKITKDRKNMIDEDRKRLKDAGDVGKAVKKEWCHADYVAEQAALKKLNGKRCQDCKKLLRGEEYLRCQKCFDKIKARNDRIDGGFEFGGTSGKAKYEWSLMNG